MSAAAHTNPAGVGAQFGSAAEADFQQVTWTFDMKFDNFKVVSGEYAILPVAEYAALIAPMDAVQRNGGQADLADEVAALRASHAELLSACEAVLEDCKNDHSEAFLSPHVGLQLFTAIARTKP